MTGELLDSDIEYAQRLFREGRSDEHITKALSLRGVERAAVNGLVTKLRSGQKMRPDMILLPRRASQGAQAG